MLRKKSRPSPTIKSSAYILYCAFWLVLLQYVAPVGAQYCPGECWHHVIDLNFFPAVNQDLGSGMRLLYSDIRIGEPSADLFEVPAGAHVSLSTVTRGIERILGSPER